LSERTKIALGVILALVLAFSLAGVSYYFPSSKESLSKSTSQSEETPSLFSSSVTDEGTTQPQAHVFSMYFTTDLPNITISYDGTIEPSEAPIKKVGDSYTFTGDIINQTLRIQRDNIIIDGAGYALQGFITYARYAHKGIVLQNRNNVTLKNMEVTQFWNGISVTNCSNITITGNKVTNIGSRAIMIDSCNNSIISDTIVDDVAIAIEIGNISGFSESVNSTVARNAITTAAQGITMESSFSIITENNFANIYIPIGARGNQTTISKNNLVNGISGIFITGSHCTIYGNNVANFSESGITINSGSTNNTLYENTIADSDRGVTIGSSKSSKAVENNTFYHNNFVNNTQNVYIGATQNQNIWEYDKEGNYWSNYNGTDRDGDGIGDTSYVIDEKNIDSYPLMTPYESMQQSNQMLLVYLGIIGLIVFAAIAIGTTLVTRRTKSKVSL